MSVEALWTVEFISNLQVFGSGVAVLETGRIFGGDAKYYYLGEYNVDPNGLVNATVRVTHFAGEPYSIFGNVKTFSLLLSGKVNVPEMELSGFVAGSPQLRIALRMTKREDLP